MSISDSPVIQRFIPMQSDSIHELAVALAKCQSEMQSASKTSKNPFFKSSYADLTDCWDACRLALTKNGLSVVQTTVPEADKVYMHTILLHSSGQWIKSIMPIICAKPNDIQAWGSSLTYIRRYSLSAIVGITTDDDDGNRANSDLPELSEAEIKTFVKKVEVPMDLMELYCLQVCTKYKISRGHFFYRASQKPVEEFKKDYDVWYNDQKAKGKI